MSKQTEALKLALEALEDVDGIDTETECVTIDVGEAITAIREALVEQPAQQQEPVACPVCNEVHAILDADDSKIIRNAEDGYPDGRELRVLTLQERVTALCVYAADWKRWCLEKENTPPPRKPLTDEEIWDEVKAADLDWQTGWSLDEDAPNRYITFASAIEAAHGIARE